MAHMNTRKVFICSTISAALWTCLIAWGGYLVGDNWEVVGEYLATYGKIMLWIVVIGVSGYVGWRFFRRRQNKIRVRSART